MSSLKKTNLSARSPMRCRFSSIGRALKVGSHSAGIKSRWSTRRSFGADSSSQSGFCPAVTRKTFRTHGAHASTARNQCRSVPKSR